MTGVAALAGDLGSGMIDERRQENSGVMAIPAIAADRDMSGRPGGCAERGVVAVVARSAIAGNTVVTENRRLERARVVAQVTILLRRQVKQRAVLAGGENVVVTPPATPGDALVRESRRQETAADRVAYAAVVRGGNMDRRLAGRRAAVMAGVAVIDDARMVEEPADEGGGDMACAAVLGRGDVIGRLAGGAARGVAAVVT